MIAPARANAYPAYRRPVRHAVGAVPFLAPRPSLWQLFLDDRRALRLKWGVLLLLLLVAALLDVPL